MQMIEVKSSNVKAIGFDGENLRIQFKNGKVYLYHNFTSEKFDELMTAPSIGKYLNAEVYRKHAYSMEVNEKNKEKTKKEKSSTEELVERAKDLKYVDREMAEMIAILKSQAEKK